MYIKRVREIKKGMKRKRGKKYIVALCHDVPAGSQRNGLKNGDAMPWRRVSYVA
jgi:hypothetical protein